MEHPEAAIKHSVDIKDRIPIYELQSKTLKHVKQNDLMEWLDDGWTLGTPIFRLITRGKDKGTLHIKFICPWKIGTSCYFKANKHGK